MTTPLSVYSVDKVCYRCGKQWTGASFVPHPQGAPPLPGVCASCNAEDERHLATLTKWRAESSQLPAATLDLVPPRLTGDR